eukprot:TRINITY_DN1150_c0_g1_i3.p1 TRINITY_DN1150_c0_g1~~TRINITY_DN1150_c0_g1_i3.p1  ORF type:complete len:551 (-),score=151.11 TRINITY_DN1150_c0_g1_i3:32-1642(-)
MEDDLRTVEEKVDKEKTAKYDRQLRLWGAHGQQALENSKILLLGAGPTGTETLKNLVLPGIGSFTIVDGVKVSPSDLGNNFFVTLDSIGQSRAKVTTDHLKELNEWVKGDFLEQDPVQLIETNIDYFNAFTFVIATNIPEVPLLKLAAHLYQKNIPLIIARAFGFLGYLRLATPEHTIVESKPDNPIDDLRLSNPFPSLVEHIKTVDLSVLDSHLHSHVPYPILLLQAISKWKSEHDGKAPSTSEEKAQFKQLVGNGALKPGSAEELNFEEAIAAAFKAYATYEIPYEVQTVLEDEKSKNITAESSDFWIIASALREFFEKEGSLPLQGSVPDMTSDTQSYMNLQEIYGKKSKEDLATITESVHSTLKKIGKTEDAISDEDIVRACKNSLYITLLRIRSLAEEHAKDTAKSGEIDMALEDPTDNTSWYLLLRSADRFYTQHKRFPGQEDNQVQDDVPVLQKIVTDLLSELGVNNTVTEDQVKETCRAGGAEMHNLGALVGGVAAQEVIKVITHQWVPMNNTLIFNGMNSTSTTTEL